MSDEDFGALKRRAGNLQYRDLITIGERTGWTFIPRRSKGSHGLLTKTGRRPITIPNTLKRGTALSIIRALELGESDD